jgi:hypothetical protein
MNPSDPIDPELEPTQELSLEAISGAAGHPEVQASVAPPPKIIGYCRECGKALDETNVYRALGTIYCEHHRPGHRSSEQSTSEQIPMDPSRPASIPPPLPYTALPYVAPPYHAGQPPFPSSSPLNACGSPGLAFVLGMIPGVGAVYNGQYGKGLMHVVIFGLAISLAHSGPSDFEPLFGLLIMCFWFYMAFEAYHTAKKRRAGLPLDEFSSVFPLQGRAARAPVGAIVLIALGVLFLLSNLEIIDMRRLLRFWPALLIVMGVYMIYTRMTVAEVNKRDGR